MKNFWLNLSEEKDKLVASMETVVNCFYVEVKEQDAEEFIQKLKRVLNDRHN